MWQEAESYCHTWSSSSHALQPRLQDDVLQYHIRIEPRACWKMLGGMTSPSLETPTQIHQFGETWSSWHKEHTPACVVRLEDEILTQGQVHGGNRCTLCPYQSPHSLTRVFYHFLLHLFDEFRCTSAMRKSTEILPTSHHLVISVAAPSLILFTVFKEIWADVMIVILMSGTNIHNAGYRFRIFKWLPRIPVN